MYSYAQCCQQTHGGRSTDRSKQANELLFQPPISQSLAQLEKRAKWVCNSIVHLASTYESPDAKVLCVIVLLEYLRLQ